MSKKNKSTKNTPLKHVIHKEIPVSKKPENNKLKGKIFDIAKVLKSKFKRGK